MYYGRLTIATAKEGEKKRVADILDRLAVHYRKQKGAIAQFCFYHDAEEERVFKVAVWKDKASADHAAQDPESLALRSQLLQFTEGHPEELGLDMTDGSGLGMDRAAIVSRGI
jgi:quinol monooxygenase YgiN